MTFRLLIQKVTASGGMAGSRKVATNVTPLGMRQQDLYFLRLHLCAVESS